MVVGPFQSKKPPTSYTSQVFANSDELNEWLSGLTSTQALVSVSQWGLGLIAVYSETVEPEERELKK